MNSIEDLGIWMNPSQKIQLMLQPKSGSVRDHSATWGIQFLDHILHLFGLEGRKVRSIVPTFHWKTPAPITLLCRSQNKDISVCFSLRVKRSNVLTNGSNRQFVLNLPVRFANPLLILYRIIWSNSKWDCQLTLPVAWIVNYGHTGAFTIFNL